MARLDYSHALLGPAAASAALRDAAAKVLNTRGSRFLRSVFLSPQVH